MKNFNEHTKRYELMARENANFTHEAEAYAYAVHTMEIYIFYFYISML